MRLIVWLPLLLTFLAGSTAQQEGPRKASLPEEEGAPEVVGRIPDEPWSAVDIKKALRRLRHLGRVLYVAAHPDDENTQLIAHMVNGEHVRTAYVSLNRGGGGQNLIGEEQGDLLGVLRTQELLQARAIDGGKQFFTRAVDFGYSKTARETFNKWDKEKVLNDLVRVIRKFRPDVMVNRFPAGGYEGAHGHHTGSAILSKEAFELAGSDTAFPHQLEKLEPWRPERLFFNTSTWWDKELPKKVEENDSLLAMDVGTYDPLLGRSYTEIAAESRSMHKCQGFGASASLGSEMEYFRLLKGSLPEGNGLMSGLNIGWSRIQGGERIEGKIRELIGAFKPERPAGIVPGLVDLLDALRKLPRNEWTLQKRKAVVDLIAACSGMHAGAFAKQATVVPGVGTRVDLKIINRSSVPFRLERMGVAGRDTVPKDTLAYNVPFEATIPLEVGAEHAYSTPYWLKKDKKDGMYRVSKGDRHLLGVPQTPPPYHGRYELSFRGTSMLYKTPVRYRWNSKVKGEQQRPFIVVPRATAHLEQEAFVWKDSSAKELEIEIRGHKEQVKGTVSLDLHKGWEARPNETDFQINDKGASEEVRFSVTPPSHAHTGELRPVVRTTGRTLDRTLETVNYEHIVRRTVIRQASSEVVKLDVRTKGKKVGYIMGAGDKVPDALRQMGYEVTLLKPGNITSDRLRKFDAVLTGIRAFNVHDPLRYKNDILFDYVKEGGRLVVQYNKDAPALVTEELGPWPFKVAYDRVTVEEAEPTFLDPGHPILNAPNDITKKDFEGWVQERGLYFAGKWDDRYTPIISWHDPGEEPRKGGLLVGDHGKGTYVYTGIAFFRQLPAGVPGAYRLFANLVSAP